MKRSVKLLAIAIAILLTFAAIPFTVFAQTTEKPADAVTNGGNAIYDAADFAAITSGGAYYLANDIDFGGNSYAYIVQDFTKGVIDGRGHKLYNFSIETSTGGAVGVFSTMASGGNVVIKNLNVGSADAKIQMTLGNSSTVDTNAGFITGTTGNLAHKLIIENVNIYGNVTVTGSSKRVRLGGIGGYVRSIEAYNCTVTGDITDNDTGTTKKYFGGLVGEIPTNTNQGSRNTFVNCASNMNVEIKVATSEGFAGGIVGALNQSAVIIGCVNNGNVNSVKAAGGIVGRQYRESLYVRDCQSNATSITATNKGDIVGLDTDLETYGAYRYIKNCTPDTQNTEATPITTLAELQTAADTGDGGIYILANDLDLEGQSFTNYVCAEFGGVIDGNGKTIYNFSITGSGKKDMGFFAGLSKEGGSDKDTLILDLKLGNSESPVKLTSTTYGKSIGVLTSYAGTGTTKTGYEMVFDNVDIHADIEHTGIQTNLGGFAGKSCYATYLNCDLYGSINATATLKDPDGDGTETGEFLNVGGFVGYLRGQKNGFYNCKNFGTVVNSATVEEGTVSTDGDANSTTISAVTAAGFIATSQYGADIINCVNLGNVTTTTDGGTNYVLASGFVAKTLANSDIFDTFLNCSNFGTVECGAKAAAINSYAYEGIASDFENYGAIIGATVSNTTIDGYEEEADLTVVEHNCKNDSIITMKTGASVKLSDPSGLRFRATVNNNAVSKLQALLGDGASLSYGTLIAPEQFVSDADAYTHSAMEDYSNVNGFKAYVDVKVVNNEWFDGIEGEIAGSVVDLKPALYGVEFTGRAYVAVTVNGYTYYLYANAPQTRSISYVAEKALGDVLYVKDGVYYELKGEEYVSYTGNENTADYNETVETVGEYTKVSPYNAQEREYLAGLIVNKE